MPYNARNCRLQIENTDMDYIVFGVGKTPLIIIPGLGDGLKNVKKIVDKYEGVFDMNWGEKEFYVSICLFLK